MKRNLTLAITLFVAIIFLINGCKKEGLNDKLDVVPSVSIGQISDAATAPATQSALGRLIFFDTNLSDPVGQSCSSCHATSVSFSDPSHNAISPGAFKGRAGNRNAPMASYSMFFPRFHYNVEDDTYEGGLFWDGRANSLGDQARKPFVNPLEMNNSSTDAVVAKVRKASYYSLFKQVYGDVTDNNAAFTDIVAAIAAFERSPEVNPFTSKYDYYLKGQAKLTDQELLGLKVFNDTLKSKCGNCHLTTPDPVSGKVLFTDFTYNSDGVPRNPANPFYKQATQFNPLGNNYRDLGLGGILNDPSLNGNFRVSSLRNIAVTAPYFHNGVFTTLEQVVHFYNTRDVPGSGFAPPEVAENVDTEETGNQHLTAKEEAAIVAFLKTLTDGYKGK